MIRNTKLLLAVIVLTLMSCYDGEQFPDTPKIEFESLEFADSQTADSLILTFSFEDGGANFGVLDNDLRPEYELFIDSEPKVLTAANIANAVPPIFLASLFIENFVPIRQDDNIITIQPGATSYPAFLQSEIFTNDVNDIVFECPNIINQNLSLFDTFDIAVYEFDDPFFENILTQDIDSEVPALYLEEYNNFIIYFERIVNGEPEEIPFREIIGSENCDAGNFNALIPLFDEEGESGTITYNIISAILRIPLESNPFRLRFFVYDRLGNKSNEVITPTYILDEITRISN
ncbi:MAG: hypothetical protein AAGC64_10780 [Bacteroidota bacterium]